MRGVTSGVTVANWSPPLRRIRSARRALSSGPVGDFSPRDDDEVDGCSAQKAVTRRRRDERVKPAQSDQRRLFVEGLDCLLERRRRNAEQAHMRLT